MCNALSAITKEAVDPFVLFVICMTLLIGFGGLYIARRHGLMSPSGSQPTLSIFQWGTLFPREQAVWAASYACNAHSPGLAVRRADRAVVSIRQLDIDDRFNFPELDIAPTGADLTYEEFVAWYPIALKLVRSRMGGFQSPDETACQAAYMRYQRSKEDFY